MKKISRLSPADLNTSRCDLGIRERGFVVQVLVVLMHCNR